MAAFIIVLLIIIVPILTFIADVGPYIASEQRKRRESQPLPERERE